MASEGRDPTWGSGVGSVSGSWDLTASPSLGSSTGFGSWDPDPNVEFQYCLSSWHNARALVHRITAWKPVSASQPHIWLVASHMR
jgi:hypothetical protein